MGANSQYEVFIDNHLTGAPGIYSLMYLYVLRFIINNQPLPDNMQICDALNIPLRDVEDAWSFWEKHGLVSRIGEEIKLTLEGEIAKVSKKKVKTAGEVIANAIRIDDELAKLYKYAQTIFKNPMTNTEIKTLYSIQDELKLPVEVMYILLNYVAKVDKVNAKYIEKIAINWVDQGIDNVIKAEELLQRIENPPKKMRRKKISGEFNNFTQRGTDYSFLEDEYFQEQLKKVE